MRRNSEEWNHHRVSHEAIKRKANHSASLLFFFLYYCVILFWSLIFWESGSYSIVHSGWKLIVYFRLAQTSVNTLSHASLLNAGIMGMSFHSLLRFIFPFSWHVMVTQTFVCVCVIFVHVWNIDWPSQSSLQFCLISSYVESFHSSLFWSFTKQRTNYYQLH